MFQHAFYKRLRKKNRLSYIIYERMTNAIHTGYSLSRVFKLKPQKAPELLRILVGTEKTPFKQIRSVLSKVGCIYHYKPDFGVYTQIESKPGINIYNGYWQSEKYFKDIEEEIRHDFQFTEICEEKNLSLLKEMKDYTSISLHVRRGDYLDFGMAFSDSVMRAYYQNAMEYLCSRVKNAVFLIFSNDINWCKDNILPPPQAENLIFVDWNTGQSSFRDMQLMSLCSHNIIANSTFSWWGAWLNPNQDKIVITPETWFPADLEIGQKEKWQDLIPESWIKIPTN